MKPTIKGNPPTIGPVRVSFPKVFEAESFLGSEPKYSIVLLFDKANKEEMAVLSAIRKMAEEIRRNDPNKPREEAIFGTHMSLIKDGDDGKYHKGFYTMRASSKRAPAIVDANRRLIDPKTANRDMIYSGCYCSVNLSIFTYTTGSVGITAGLNGVMFVKDGERLGSSAPSPAEMFGAPEESPYDAVDDMFGTHTEKEADATSSEEESTLPF